MKKKILIGLLLSCVLLLTGCGSNKEASVVSCKYSANEESVGVVVEMKFERDNEAELITNGQVSMSYVFADITSDEATSTNSIITSMFDGICDDLGSIYKDCDLNINGNSAEVVMVFDLDVLETTSGGSFTKNMSVSQVKGYIQTQSEIDGLVCTTE